MKCNHSGPSFRSKNRDGVLQQDFNLFELSIYKNSKRLEDLGRGVFFGRLLEPYGIFHKLSELACCFDWGVNTSICDSLSDSFSLLFFSEPPENFGKFLRRLELLRLFHSMFERV